MSRYAEGTTVSVESSRGEITGILAKHGVQRMGWYTEPERDVLQFEIERDVLQFEIEGRGYRLHIDRPTAAELREQRGREYTYPDNVDWDKKAADEWRRRWRANVLLLKAKLEFADGETSTVERELMPYMLLKDGRTLEAAIGAGSVPLLAKVANGR